MAQRGDIGFGKVYGKVPDRAIDGMVPLRTPPSFVATYGRGYKKDGQGGIRLTHKAGTQWYHYRAKSKRRHLGEDIYVKHGIPVYAPFDGTVEAIYPSGGGDYGDIIVLRSSKDPRIKLRLVHMRKVRVKRGQRVRSGEQLALTYTPARFPGGDPSHIHLEAIVYPEPGAGKPGDKGNRQPFSVIDAQRLVVSSPEVEESAQGLMVLTSAAMLATLIGYGLYRGLS